MNSIQGCNNNYRFVLEAEMVAIEGNLVIYTGPLYEQKIGNVWCRRLIEYFTPSGLLEQASKY
jgi:hypothetical protein